MKYLVALFLFPFSFCKPNFHKQKKDIAPAPPVINSNSCVLVNTTSQKIDFVYSDKFGNDVQFFVAPQKTIALEIDSFIILTQPNEYQSNYFISKGDSLNISLNKNNIAILESKSDSNENRNLNIATYINEKLNYSSMRLSSLIGSKKLDYHMLDSIIVNNYHKQLEYLYEYCQKSKCSKEVKSYFEFDFKSSLINYKFFIGQRYKQQLSLDYTRELDSLNNQLEEIYLNRFANRNGNLRISFLAYKHSKPNSLISNDSLYYYCKTGSVNKVNDEAKFWVVKNELQKNRKSSKWFINDFKQVCADKDLVGYVMSMEENNRIVYDTKKNNKLFTLDNISLSYDSLINSFTGSIIYLDLWASWCAPCRANINTSHTLKKKLKNNKIVFLYLSIDDNIQAWKRASKEEGLDEKESYLLLNSQNSTLIRNLKVSSIPRYIIIGKNGKIANANAPSPDNELLLTEFSKLAEKRN